MAAVLIQALVKTAGAFEVPSIPESPHLPTPHTHISFSPLPARMGKLMLLDERLQVPLCFLFSMDGERKSVSW